MESPSFPRFACIIKKKRAAGSTKKNAQNNRRCMRRGSSLSNLDQISQALPDLVRCTTADNHLFVASDDHLQNSPNASRSFLASSNTMSIGGSFGDLMNMKQFGSSQWSLRSESLIAKTVPLSTVTSKNHAKNYFPDEMNVSLTAAQRTLRLSKLIEQQRNSRNRKSQTKNIAIEDVVYEEASEIGDTKKRNSKDPKGEREEPYSFML
ncbi:hypothetical protein JTB14_006284 [Gonioctena quinquepunctata]|nr:hypothetical protein JTB14_006284 [Gonioctena quinquepunctata]